VTAYATIQDLTDRFPRPLTASETDQVPILLDDASFLLSIKVPGLQAAVDSGNEDVTRAAMMLTVAMVKRSLLTSANQQAVNNPAIDQVSEAWGPYSQVIKLRPDQGNLFLYDNELESLLALLRGDTATAVSVRSPGL
jgi:hypothetical protein